MGTHGYYSFPQIVSCYPGQHLFTIIIADSETPGTILSLPNVLSHLTLRTTSEGRHHYACFTDHKTETQ